MFQFLPDIRRFSLSIFVDEQERKAGELVREEECPGGNLSLGLWWGFLRGFLGPLKRATFGAIFSRDTV